jgi:hypothetical protein
MSFYVENNYYQGSFATGSTIFADNFECHGAFSINASNQFRGTLWLTKNGETLNTDLDPADYVVYDADGNLVSGISQSNISPDINGLYEITPVSALPLVDLTHYIVKITINFSGETYSSFRGITLAE